VFRLLFLVRESGCPLRGGYRVSSDSKKKMKWERTIFRKLINVYSEHDKILKKWKYAGRPAALKTPVSPCGIRPIKTKYISKVINIDLSDIVESSHKKYHIVFLNGMLKYDGKWCLNALVFIHHIDGRSPVPDARKVL
jgi:hypothetical protein